MIDLYQQHYINGQWVDSIGGKAHHIINPATEEPSTKIVFGTSADVDAAAAAAKEALKTFRETTREERVALLERIVAEYEKRLPDIAQSIAKELGAPVSFGEAVQGPAGMGAFLGTVEALKVFEFKQPKGEYVAMYEPVGVVGMITPWNWPLNQIALKVAPALAGGNTMVLKPSEETPGSAAILAEIMHAAGVPAGVFNLVQGDGPTVGNAIAAHPDIDMVSFTGSTRAGVLVAKTAADSVKRVHQELGGKAPNLVLPNADLQQFLPPTISGVLLNTGQTCIAPTRVLIQKDQITEAINIIKELVDGTAVDDPMVAGEHIGPVVNKAQHEKIKGLIQSAIDEGATLEAGGTDLPANIDRGFYIQPTLLSGVTPEMRIANEEIFGPVITLISYDDLEEGVQLANSTPFGLSSVITGDPLQAAAVAPRINAGMVTINDWMPQMGAPFGGYKQSGNGREGGVFGLHDFMEVKAVSGLPA